MWQSAIGEWGQEAECDENRLSVHKKLGFEGVFSLTGIEPNWFEIENRLPYCVKKA